MSNTLIHARITDQAVQVISAPAVIASGSHGVLLVEGTFDGLWDGYAKIAVFYRDEAEVYHVPMGGDLAEVPSEVLADDGHFYLGFVGVADNTRTTEMVHITVKQGAITVGMPSERPTHGILEQILAAYGQMDARLSEQILMRGASSNKEYTFSDEYISNGRILTNGAMAFMSFEIKNMSLIAGGQHTTDYCIPPDLAPLANVYDLSTTHSDINVTFERGPINGNWGRLLIENVGNDMITTDMTVKVEGFYPLNHLFIEELADVRVGADGKNYETAGDAVRGIGSGLLALGKPVKTVNDIPPDVEGNVEIDVKGMVFPACANAIKATARGEGSVRIDDVSPLKHTASVKVRGKNLIPAFLESFTMEKEEITQSVEAGGQTITIQGTGNAAGGGRNSFRDQCRHFFLEKGKTYTLTMEIVSGEMDLGTCSVYISKFPDFSSVTSVSNKAPSRTFIAEEDAECYIGVNVVAGGLYNNVIVRFQLEEGDTATEYEPWVDPQLITVKRWGADEYDSLEGYTPDAEGKLDIPALHPVMTVTARDAVGDSSIKIECEYNRDINQALANTGTGGGDLKKAFIVNLNLDDMTTDAGPSEMLQHSLDKGGPVFLHIPNPDGLDDYIPLSWTNGEFAEFARMLDDYVHQLYVVDESYTVQLIDLDYAGLVRQEDFYKAVGDISTALDHIIALQEELIGT